MPLTTRNKDHMHVRIRQTLLGRSQKVILNLRNIDGTISQITVNAVWRIQDDSEATLEGPGAAPTHIGAPAEVWAIFNQDDVTIAQLRACIFAELPAGSPGTQLGSHYVIISIQPIGMLPGGDRFLTQWTRQR